MSKCMLQSLTELRGTPDTKTTRKHIVCNASHLARSCQVSKYTNFLNLLLLLPAALKVLIYEVTFLGQYDSTIISFCVRIEYSTSMTQKCGLDWTLPTWCLAYDFHEFPFPVEKFFIWTPQPPGKFCLLAPTLPWNFH